MLATLRRLGWTPLRWDRWETSTGLVVDLRDYGSRAVKALVDAGAKDALLRGLSLQGEALGASDAPLCPHLEPLLEVCRESAPLAADPGHLQAVATRVVETRSSSMR
eukprot:8518464-Pyramimonas_sp.AAC.1